MLALGVAACIGACTGDAAKDARGQGASAGDIPGSTRPVGHELAGGTRVAATIQTALSSRTNKAGETLQAIVSGDVKDARGGIVIPAGSTVTLTVAQLEAGNDRTTPNGKLSLVVSSVMVDGRSHSLSAKLEPVPFHLEGRGVTGAGALRDVVVSAGTPIVFTLAQSLNVSGK